VADLVDHPERGIPLQAVRQVGTVRSDSRLGGDHHRRSAAAGDPDRLRIRCFPGRCGGFGAPVAITAAILATLGLNPLYAAGLCLIANTAPVAFGALGIPILVAGKTAGIDPFLVGQMAGRQLPLLSLFVPFFIVWLMDGFKGVRQTWPAVLVAGASFAGTQFVTSNYIGPELPDITSALVCLAVTTFFLKVWHPKHAYAAGSGSGAAAPVPAKGAKRSSYTTGQIFKAWSPFIILTVVVVIWTLPGFRSLFDAGGPLYGTTLSFQIPGLHDAVIKTAPIVDKATPYAATYKLDLIAATGSGILLAAVLSMFVLGISPREGIGVFKETVKDLVKSIVTISLVLGFAFIANYSGVSSTLALAIASSGHWFPFFSPVLGWLGVFLTGSDTSSNALFSSLQSITAHQIGVSDVLMVAANSTGGVTGKMISPQSIAVACAAVGLVGRESELLRFTAKWSIVFLLIICVITYVQAYHLQWMIP
jgi:lactate permease